jgi:AraC-like DNA-binding protein
MLVERRPAPPLAAYVERLWCSARPALPHAREWGLPGVHGDIVVPLSADALWRFDGIDDRRGEPFRGGLVQGARERPVLRDTSRASVAVGVQFRPGGLAAFFDEPADAFTDRAVALPDVWGGCAHELRERLLACGDDAQARLALFEALLLRRLRDRADDAMAVWAIERFAHRQTTVRGVQRASGCAPQTFIRRFAAATGLKPKRYCELLRFGDAVVRGHASPAPAWADVAAQAGYADQAHLSREFRRFAGLSPTRWKRDATAFAMHVAAR